MWLTVKVEWLQAFVDKIDNKKEVTFWLNKWIKKVMFFLEAEAIPFTPVDKWFLHNSYRQKFWNLTWKLFNLRKYATAVHEWHAQTPWRFVPAIWARLVRSFVKWNPFLTKTIKKSWKKTNLIMNKELKKVLSILQ